MNTKVSIVVPCYNSNRFIRNTITSVQNQTYENWELLIVDDCSTDGSIDTIKSLAENDSRIKYFLNEKNMGPAHSRNVGLEHADGRFIAFLDSDDMWLPPKLAIQTEFMTNNAYPISFCAYQLIDTEGHELNKTINTVESIDYTGYLKNTIIGMSTTMIDTDIVGRDFNFINIPTRQDTYLWISLLKRGFCAYGINQVLASYRVRPDSISANKFSAMARVWYLYYNLEKLGLWRSAYYFSHYAFNTVRKRLPFAGNKAA